MEATIGLEDAARFLRMAPSTLRRRAAAGIVPAYKPGRQWVFLPSEIAEYLKGTRPQHHSIDVARLRIASGSSPKTSASQLADEIRRKRKQLALVPGGKRSA
jgi:hypothetical protein